MNPDLKCPYCGLGQDVDPECRLGYAEDEEFEQECERCLKTFMVGTWVTVSYSTKTADCLNGGEHKYRPTKTYPVEYTKMRCDDCNVKRQPTDAEMITIKSQEQKGEKRWKKQ